MMLLNIPPVCVSYNLLSKYAHATQGQIHEKYTETPYYVLYMCLTKIGHKMHIYDGRSLEN